MLFLLLFSLAVFLSFLLLFHFQKLGPLDFWPLMSGLILFFSLLIFLFFPQERELFWKNLKRKPAKMAFGGIITAFLLYSFFYLGSLMWLKIWPESQEPIRQVYNLKGQTAGWSLVIYLGSLIGPGEEVIWRWFLQRRWAKLIGQRASFLAVAISYSLVHLTTGNYLLMMAALICGLYWGWLFGRTNSILINMVSHSLWDIFIFVLWPIIK